MDDAQRIERDAVYGLLRDWLSPGDAARVATQIGRIYEDRITSLYANLAAHEQQQLEIARLRVDAERYQWLRSHECADALYAGPCFDVLKGGAWLDESIDAALAATAPMRVEGT